MTDQQATSLVELAACPEHRRETYRPVEESERVVVCASQAKAERLRAWYAAEYPERIWGIEPAGTLCWLTRTYHEETI